MSRKQAFCCSWRWNQTLHIYKDLITPTSSLPVSNPILGPVTVLRVTTNFLWVHPPNSMNSRCIKIFERPQVWLAIWQPSFVHRSTSFKTFFLIHTWECPCLWSLVFWTSNLPALLFILSSLNFLVDVYEGLFIGCLLGLAQAWDLWPKPLQL